MESTNHAGVECLQGKHTTADVMKPMTVDKAKKVSRTVKGSTVTTTAVENTEKPCHFLELPPELRNRIYHYADEEFEDLEYLPLLRPRSLYSPKPSWKFFGLVQSCKQIRAEYRPLWLSNSRVRVQPENLGPFVDAFFPDLTGLKQAPGLLEISWTHRDNYEYVLDMEVDLYHGYDRDIIEQQTTDLTPLLRLHANCPSFHSEFVPHKLMHGWSPGDMCDDCAKDGWDSADEEDIMAFRDECPCQEVDRENWENEKHGEMDYVQIIERFLSNTNEAWLKDIQEHRVEVSCFWTLCGASGDGMKEGGPWTPMTETWVFRIRFHRDSVPKVLLQDNPRKAVLEYLKDRDFTAYAQSVNWYQVKISVEFQTKYNPKIHFGPDETPDNNGYVHHDVGFLLLMYNQDTDEIHPNPAVS
ncbi:hypothetical protein P153DRAFT_393732 [Dothidotthia symphoricarpi CBS 119687]|uniref:F-box domain-containing protein n=1 Tax=Dothidotthia symphoricarpi CBS 119687 TaxID=1392245 RepID=A0A6A6AMI7_9PLEO|nr:uncharacterized protein P153DRAFT_393732 [Dothidotthia symphoricarpi CBS 119687]KAF2132776.1 hypothetical protein P153DRAFT_393732 [Dothidotthia symphoricarpi CBS 119687]